MRKHTNQHSIKKLVNTGYNTYFVWGPWQNAEGHLKELAYTDGKGDELNPNRNLVYYAKTWEDYWHAVGMYQIKRQEAVHNFRKGRMRVIYDPDRKKFMAYAERMSFAPKTMKKLRNNDLQSFCRTKQTARKD